MFFDFRIFPDPEKTRIFLLFGFLWKIRLIYRWIVKIQCFKPFLNGHPAFWAAPVFAMYFRPSGHRKCRGNGDTGVIFLEVRYPFDSSADFKYFGAYE